MCITVQMCLQVGEKIVWFSHKSDSFYILQFQATELSDIQTIEYFLGMLWDPKELKNCPERGKSELMFSDHCPHDLALDKVVKMDRWMDGWCFMICCWVLLFAFVFLC